MEKRFIPAALSNVDDIEKAGTDSRYSESSFGYDEALGES